jgi:flagellar basal-body rod protein FlgB
MPEGPLVDRTGLLLHESLSGLVKRQQLITNNLANVDTPGYKALDVPFEQVLNREIGKQGDLRMVVTQPGHISSDGTMEQALSMQQPVVFRTDANGVDMDAEMARLAETSVQFDAVSQLMAGRLAIMRMAVREGR